MARCQVLCGTIGTTQIPERGGGVVPMGPQWYHRYHRGTIGPTQGGSGWYLWYHESPPVWADRMGPKVP